MWQVPSGRICVGWARGGDREPEQRKGGRKSSMVKKEGSRSAPRDASWAPEGRHMRKLPSEDRSHPGVPFRVRGTFANTRLIGSIFEGLKERKTTLSGPA